MGGQIRSLYSLRHTCATEELLAGIDIHTVARQKHWCADVGEALQQAHCHYGGREVGVSEGCAIAQLGLS